MRSGSASRVRRSFLLALAICVAAPACGGGDAEKPKEEAAAPQESAFSLYRKGIYLYRHSDCDAAAPLLSQAAELKPDLLEAHVYAGKCYMSSRKVDLEAAEKHFLAALALKPDHIEARMDLARTYFAWGRYEDAAKQLDELLSMVPTHRLALHYAGMVAVRMGDYAKAAEFLRRTLNEIPDSVDTWLELGDALSHQQRDEEALSAFQEVLKLSPGNIRALLGAGTSLQRLGRDEEAKEYLVKFKDSQATAEQAEMRLKRIRVRVSVAKRAFKEEREEDGKREVKLFLEEFADDPDALTELGAMQASLARVQEAEETFKRVVEIAPTHRKANEMLAELYRRIGENSKASSVQARYQEALERAAAARPN